MSLGEMLDCSLLHERLDYDNELSESKSHIPGLTILRAVLAMSAQHLLFSVAMSSAEAVSVL